MATTILLIRHADVFNPDNVIYGRLPHFRLSDYGQYFARKTATHLANMPIAAFYTSPLLRALQTTRILAAPHAGVPVRSTSRLSEVRSSWQGTRYNDLPPDKTVYDLRREPTDESIDDVWQRMSATVRALAQQHADQTVACVSHGDPIKIATLGFQGRTLDGSAVREPDPARCSVTSLTFHAGADKPAVAYEDVVGASDFRKVASLDDLAPNTMLKVQMGRQDVLLFRISGGEVYATQNRCGHMRTCLDEGSFDGTLVTCPLHGAQFDVTSGKVVRQPDVGAGEVSRYGTPGKLLSPIETQRLRAFEVEIRGSEIFAKSR